MKIYSFNTSVNIASDNLLLQLREKKSTELEFSKKKQQTTLKLLLLFYFSK